MRNIIKVDGEEYELLGTTASHPLYVLKDAPLEVKLRLLAAGSSYVLGVKSIDRVLKEYRDVWKEKLEKGS